MKQELVYKKNKTLHVQCRKLFVSGMKNVDQSDSNDIPPTPSHSNLITSNLNSIEEGNQEHIKSKNDKKTSNLEDDKEKQSPKLGPDNSSISHPKVIDILDNQLEQL